MGITARHYLLGRSHDKDGEAAMIPRRALRYTGFGHLRGASLTEVPAPKLRSSRRSPARRVRVEPTRTKKRSGWLGVELPPGGVIPHRDSAGTIAAAGEAVPAAPTRAPGAIREPQRGVSARKP